MTGPFGARLRVAILWYADEGSLCLSMAPAPENVLFRKSVFGDFRANVVNDGLNFERLRFLRYQAGVGADGTT